VFRAALLGLFGRGRSRNVAVAMSSVLFGLWHVLPTLESLGPAPVPTAHDGTGPLRRQRVGRTGIVAGVVVATAAAGAAFAGLRLRSRSVLAPVVAHAALDVAAMLASRVVSTSPATPPVPLSG